eukprot:3694898-Pyramimonas_sp.AAC.1
MHGDTVVSTLTVRIAVAVSSSAGVVMVGKSIAARVFGFVGAVVAIVIGADGVGVSGMSSLGGVPYDWQLLVDIHYAAGYVQTSEFVQLAVVQREWAHNL